MTIAEVVQVDLNSILLTIDQSTKLCEGRLHSLVVQVVQVVSHTQNCGLKHTFIHSDIYIFFCYSISYLKGHNNVLLIDLDLDCQVVAKGCNYQAILSYS